MANKKVNGRKVNDDEADADASIVQAKLQQINPGFTVQRCGAVLQVRLDGARVGAYYHRVKVDPIAATAVAQVGARTITLVSEGQVTAAANADLTKANDALAAGDAKFVEAKLQRINPGFTVQKAGATMIVRLGGKRVGDCYHTVTVDPATGTAVAQLGTRVTTIIKGGQVTTETIADTLPAEPSAMRELEEAVDQTLAKPQHTTRSAATTGIFLPPQAGIDRAAMVTTTLAILMCCHRRHNSATMGVGVDYFPLAFRSANVVRAVASYLWLRRHEFCLIRGEKPDSNIVVSKRGTRFTCHPISGCILVVGPEPLTKNTNRLQLKLLKNGEGKMRACCAFGVITESKIKSVGHKLPMSGTAKDYSFIWSDGDTWGADHWANTMEASDPWSIVSRKRHCKYQAVSHIDIQYRMPTLAPASGPRHGSASMGLFSREKHGCMTWHFKGDGERKYNHLGVQHSEPVYWCVVCYKSNIEVVWEICS